MTVNDPTILVSLDDTPVVVIGEPGNFTVQSLNPELVKAVKKNFTSRQEVPLISGMPGALYPTGQNTYLEIIASIFAVDTGRARLVEAPQEVWDELQAKAGKPLPGAVY